MRSRMLLLGKKIAIPTANLISYWQLQSNAEDSMSANNGSLMGSAAFTSGGVLGGCANLSAADAGIQIPASDSINFGNGSTDVSFSINLWVKFNSFASGSTIFRKGNGPTIEYNLLNSSGLYIRGGVFDNNASNALRKDSYYTFSLGQWYMMTQTYNGNGGVKLYINGVLTPMIDANIGSYIAMENTGLTLTFGRIAGTTSNTSNVYMCENSLWNIELNAGQVRAIFNKNTAGKNLFE